MEAQHWATLHCSTAKHMNTTTAGTGKVELKAYHNISFYHTISEKVTFLWGKHEDFSESYSWHFIISSSGGKKQSLIKAIISVRCVLWMYFHRRLWFTEGWSSFSASLLITQRHFCIVSLESSQSHTPTPWEFSHKVKSSPFRDASFNCWLMNI